MGGSGTPIKLKWSDFDDTGSAIGHLKNVWLNQNSSVLRSLCRNAPSGRSHVSGPIGTRVKNEPRITLATPFISQWRSDVWNHDSGVTINHDCEKKECTMEFGLNLKAYDISDFNPGDSFGLGGAIQDDWFIWVRDEVPLVGADFTIYANNYIKVNSHKVRY